MIDPTVQKNEAEGDPPTTSTTHNPIDPTLRTGLDIHIR